MSVVRSGPDAGGRILRFLQRHPRLVAPGLAIAAVVFTCLAAEGGIRIVTTWVRPTIMVFDRDLGWAHRPDVRRTYRNEDGRAVCRTNALGLRGPLPGAHDSRTRLLILGDSYADGLEVSDEDLFSNQWSRQRPDLALFNGAVGAYNTVQELLLLRRIAPSLKPDWVVLMVSWNDLVDNAMPFSPGIGPRPFLDAGGRMHGIVWRHFQPLLLPVPGAAWLHEHSLAAYLLQNRILQSFPFRKRAEYVDSWLTAIPESQRWKLLEGMIREVSSSLPTIVVGVPSREDVAAGRREFTDQLAGLAGRLGLQFVDLQSVLRAQDYYTRDIHWRASGHHQVARRLAASILPPHSYDSSGAPARSPASTDSR